jgi:hypothetical protein
MATPGKDTRKTYWFASTALACSQSWRNRACSAVTALELFFFEQNGVGTWKAPPTRLRLETGHVACGHTRNGRRDRPRALELSVDFPRFLLFVFSSHTYLQSKASNCPVHAVLTYENAVQKMPSAGTFLLCTSRIYFPKTRKKNLCVIFMKIGRK